MKRPRGLAGKILDLLADASRGLTLNQIQQLLDGYHELAALSACMVRLQRLGLVVAEVTERTAERGRRQVKAYRLARPP